MVWRSPLVFGFIVLSAGAQWTVLLPDGRSAHLPLQAIGGYWATGLAHCAQLWAGQAQLKHAGTELHTPDGIIRAAPLSFFLAWETSQGCSVMQLPVPVQSDGRQLFVPLQGLGQALAALLGAQAEWLDSTTMRLRRRAAQPSPAGTPLLLHPRPLQIPPDTASPRPPRLPYHGSPRTAPLLAALGSSFATAPVEITHVEAHRTDSAIVLRFRANGTIERYQRPEWDGRQLIVRIPDVLHTASVALDLPELEGWEVQRIREITVYRFRFRSPIRSCQWERNGPRELRFSILLAEPALSTRWELDVIVIDPGHGGHDHGAISLNGHAEKDITLRIALKLRQILERTLPGVRVVLTRQDDTFVPLYRRGQLANEHRGKLFLSLHCNAAPTKPHPARGIETYVLRPGRSPEAIQVAERENAVIRLEADPSRYEGLLDEQRILATLAQSAFMRLSDRLAALVQRELVATTGLPDRGIGQAGFYVLMGASMPAVLVELGFLSNPEDERFLTSSAGQWRIARALARAISQYAAEYASLLR